MNKELAGVLRLQVIVVLMSAVFAIAGDAKTAWAMFFWMTVGIWLTYLELEVRR